MREYFCAYHSMLGGTRKLSDAECGRLFRALLRYSSGTDVELINLQGREEVLFDVYSQQIDRDTAAYEEKCAKNTANASERKRSQPNASERKRSQPNASERSQDKDKDKGKEKDKDKDEHISGGIDACAADDERPDFNTVEVYAANNLSPLNGGNMEEFAAFKADIPEELIRHAIDEACAQGKRTWSYVRSILNRYRESGFKTVGEVRKADAERKAKGKTVSPAPRASMNYQQREYKDDFGFYNPAEDYG